MSAGEHVPNSAGTPLSGCNAALTVKPTRCHAAAPRRGVESLQRVAAKGIAGSLAWHNCWISEGYWWFGVLACGARAWCVTRSVEGEYRHDNRRNAVMGCGRCMCKGKIFLIVSMRVEACDLRLAH